MPSEPEGKTRVTFDRLRYFVEVGNRTSLRDAARVLGIAQPALSSHITLLEQSLGFRLLERSTRGVELTAMGRLFHLRALTVTQSADRLLEYARNLANADEGIISIACYPVHIERFLGHVIGKLRAELPGVTVDLSQMRDDRRRGWGRSLFEEVASGEIDIAMGPPHMKLMSLKGIKAFEARIVALVPDNHRGRHNRTIPITDLADERVLIAPERYFSREKIASLAKDAGIQLQVVAESSSPPALLVLGRNGLGIPILPDDYPLVGQQRFPYPVITDAEGNEVMTDVWLQWKDDESLSPAAKRFIELAQEEVQRELEHGRRNESYYQADLNP